ncbi:MAG TPA: alpha/beta fold hydrolase [Candidatus Binatia bacterium]|nr:alpha/beta fold hydrolase [Candidatus Binatia bacterium]
MKRCARLLAAALVSALVSVNVIAYLQVRAMTHFTESGQRTARPEQLGALQTAAIFLSGVQVPRPQNSRTPAALDLPFETYRFPSENGSTIEAWYIPGKDERLVVLLFHGYAASKSTLLSAAKAFHELGYPTMLIDFYGSGGSSGSDTTVGVEEAHDVAAAANFIRRKWPARKIGLYGISMGGAAVLRAVANGVKADAVIIESVFDTLLHTAKNRFRLTGLPGSPFAELLIFWGSLQRGTNFFAHNPVDYARAVRTPAMILNGELDQHAPVEEARRIAQAMGENARLVTYPEVPHRAIVEARPSEWRRDVGEFLQRVL